MLARKQLDELELGEVGVLELVHQDVREPFPVCFPHNVAGPQQVHGPVDHVIEVDQPLVPLVLLVGLVHLQQVSELVEIVPLLLVNLGSLLALQVILEDGRGDQFVPERADPVDDRRDDLGGVVPDFDVLEPEGVDIPQGPDEHVRPADDPTRDRDPACEHVLPQHPVAERVERVNVEVKVRSLLFDSLIHLRCGFLGEGERQDLVWLYALIDEVEDLFGDDARFAGTGACEDELEAGSGNGFVLRGVEGHLWDVGGMWGKRWRDEDFTSYSVYEKCGYNGENQLLKIFTLKKLKRARNPFLKKVNGFPVRRHWLVIVV